MFASSTQRNITRLVINGNSKKNCFVSKSRIAKISAQTTNIEQQGQNSLSILICLDKSLAHTVKMMPLAKI